MPEFLFRDVPPKQIEISGTHGGFIDDDRGERYLDMVMGWCVGNAGWNQPALMKSIKRFNGPIYALPDAKYKRWDVLAEKLVSLLPSRSGTCFRATGGTEAVEVALKIARAYNHRRRFIAFDGAYHGQSLACMSLVGMHPDKFGPYPDDYIRLSSGDWDIAAKTAVEAINKRDVCAFIAEPIICNLGVLVPPRSFFQEVFDACKETETVFIADEVATGFGRTGRWFAFEHYGLEPDIITIAKGFSSGLAPIGAAIAKPAIAEAMRFEFSNYSTFGWHPLSTEAAIANIDFLDRKRLIPRSEKMGRYLTKRLEEFCRPQGKGLCVGFDLKNPDFEADCLKERLIISQLGKRGVVFPSLNVKKAEIDQAIDIIRRNL